MEETVDQRKGDQTETPTSGEKRDTELSSRHSLRSFRFTIRAAGSLVMGRGEMKCIAKAVAISPLRVKDMEER